jgi:hypothetical protein
MGPHGPRLGNRTGEAMDEQNTYRTAGCLKSRWIKMRRLWHYALLLV